MDRERFWYKVNTLPEGGTYNTHPGGSVESSSAHSVPGGLPRSSAPPHCLSSLPGYGWCWTRWTSSHCPAGIPHLERDRGDEMMEGKGTGGVANKQINRRNGPAQPFFMLRHHLPPSSYGGRGEATGREGGWERKGDFKGDDRGG